MGSLPPPMTISERHVRTVITRDPDIVVRSPSMLSAVSACHAAVPPWDDSWRRSRVFSTRRRGTISGLSTSERSICCRQTRPHLPTYETPPANLFEIPVDYAVDYSTTPNDPWLSFAAAESPRASEFSGRPEHAMSPRRDLRSGLQPAFSSTIPRLIPSRPCRTGRRRSEHAVRAKPESE